MWALEEMYKRFIGTFASWALGNARVFPEVVHDGEPAVHHFTRPTQEGNRFDGASDRLNAIPMDGVEDPFTPAMTCEAVSTNLRSAAGEMDLVIVVGSYPCFSHAEHRLGPGVR
jgi:hypothetical protein